MKASRAELRAALVERRLDDHKGVYGHVLVIGGSRGMLGAPVLAAKAALRSGAGLVTLAVPEGLQAKAAPCVLEALTLGLSENAAGTFTGQAVARLKAAADEKKYTVMALGPGISRHAEAARFTLGVLGSLDLPAVIDADALNILAAQESSAVRELLRRRRACVFTPHPGEMARCLALPVKAVQARRQECAQRLARDWGGVALLKGPETIISSGARTLVNATGGPALAKGGTGDVLTGLIAGLWAQRLASGQGGEDLPFWSAVLGAHLHGLAGEIAAREKTAVAITAGDVVEALPQAFKLVLR